ncbi:MAG: hypothetical protein K6F79_07275 [Saccharofermentans sp.]|nr:hypothetical protein [Saccharofermentans sp.]
MKNKFSKVQLLCVILIASTIATLAFPWRQLRADSDIQETDQSDINEYVIVESNEGTEETLVTEMTEPLTSSETVEQSDISDTTAETTETVLESSSSAEQITEPSETTTPVELFSNTPTENPTVTPTSTHSPDDSKNYSVFSQGEETLFGYQKSFDSSDWSLCDGASMEESLIILDNDILTGNARATYNGVRSFSPDYTLSGSFSFCSVNVNSYYELRNDLEFCIISPDESSDEGLTGPSISIYFDPVHGTISILCNRDRENPIVTASCPELLDGYYNDIWYEYDGQTHMFSVYATEDTLVEMVTKPEDPVLSCEIDLSEVFNGCDSFTCMFELYDWLRSTVVISGLEIDPNPSLHKNSNYGVKSEDDSRNERENERRSGSGIPLADWTCYDEAGGKIARWYLFGMGKERIIIDDPFWTEYMESRSELLHQVQDAVFAEANRMEVGQVNKVVDITCHMELDNGEGVVGYNFLHGSEPTVGDFEISGTITRLENGDVKYNLTYTWNDIMDPNEIYPTDRFKNSILKQIQLCKFTLAIYVMRVTWSDESVIGNNSYGWLSNE